MEKAERLELVTSLVDLGFTLAEMSKYFDYRADPALKEDQILTPDKWKVKQEIAALLAEEGNEDSDNEADKLTNEFTDAEIQDYLKEAFHPSEVARDFPGTAASHR